MKTYRFDCRSTRMSEFPSAMASPMLLSTVIVQRIRKAVVDGAACDVVHNSVDGMIDVGVSVRNGVADVGQLFVGGRLRESRRQSQKKQENTE